MALNKLNFRKHSQQLRVALAGILALALVLGTGVQSHATTPDAAYIYHIKGNDLFIGSGASSERKPAALKNQLRGNTILYVPAGNRGWANLGFIVDAPFDSAGLLVQAGPHNVASQWSFPCTASGGFKLAWKQGGERGCEEGVRMKRSGSQRSRLTLPNDQGLLAAKDILKAQADAEEVIVAPPSSESSVAQVYESANGIEVETVQGNILVKSAKNPQGRLISEGQRYSYPQDTTAPIDRNAILQTPEMQDFLNPSNWSSPDIPQRISDSIAGQLGQHRTALGLPSQPVGSNWILEFSGYNTDGRTCNEVRTSLKLVLTGSSFSGQTPVVWGGQQGFATINGNVNGNNVQLRITPPSFGFFYTILNGYINGRGEFVGTSIVSDSVCAGRTAPFTLRPESTEPVVWNLDWPKFSQISCSIIGRINTQVAQTGSSLFAELTTFFEDASGNQTVTGTGKLRGNITGNKVQIVGDGETVSVGFSIVFDGTLNPNDQVVGTATVRGGVCNGLSAPFKMTR